MQLLPGAKRRSREGRGHVRKGCRLLKGRVLQKYKDKMPREIFTLKEVLKEPSTPLSRRGATKMEYQIRLCEERVGRQETQGEVKGRGSRNGAAKTSTSSKPETAVIGRRSGEDRFDRNYHYGGEKSAEET